MRGSLWEKTSCHRFTAMSIGRILCPQEQSRPNCKIRIIKRQKCALSNMVNFSLCRAVPSLLKRGGANFNLLRPINIKIAIYCPRSGSFWLNGRQFHNFWATKMANPNFWGSIKFPDHWWPKKGGGGSYGFPNCTIFLAKWSSIPQFLSYRNGKPQFLG